MQPSPELRELMLRFYQAETTGDVSFVEQFVSRQPGVLSIGSDPSEWWPGYDAFIELTRSQAQDMGNVQVTGANPQAYSEGTVGWAADRAAFEFPDGTRIPFRLTAVFHQEDGAWKLVQSHSSVGVRNDELMGRR